MENDKEKKTAVLRAAPLPDFADGGWVRAQFGGSSPKIHRHIAGNLAKRFAHWAGDEEEDAFFAKISQDLPVPGFLDDVLSAAWRDGKKPSKPPFNFIFRRVFVRSGGGGSNLKDEKQFVEAVLHALKAKHWEDARDLAFFSALWTRSPEIILGLISPFPECVDLLRTFLSDFKTKNTEDYKRRSFDSLNEKQGEWEDLSQQCIDILQTRAKMPPDTKETGRLKKRIDEMDKIAHGYSNISEIIAGAKLKETLYEADDQLSPFSKDDEVTPLRKRITELVAKKGRISLPGKFEIKSFGEKIGELTTLLKRKGEGENTVQQKISAAARHLLTILDGKIKDDKPPEPPKTPSPPPPAPAAVQVVPVLEEEHLAAPEEEKPPAPQELTAVEKAEKKYADKVNRAVAQLIMHGEFDAAYYIAQCGDDKNADIPLAALRLLSFPELSAFGGEEICEELETGVKNDADKTAKTAIFAAALFPAVFHLSTATRALFRDDGYLAGVDEILDAARKLLATFDNRFIGVDDFIAPINDGDSFATVQKELAAWYEEKKMKILKFAPATYGWQLWMKEGGTLGKIILPLTGDAPKKGLKDTETFLRMCNNSNIMDHLVADMEGNKVEGRQRIQLQSLLDDITALIQKTVDALKKESPAAHDSLAEKCGNFLNALDAAINAKSAAVDAAQNASADGEEEPTADDGEKIAVSCLRRARRFFGERERRLLVAGEALSPPVGMAKIIGIRHDSRGEPFKYSPHLVELTTDALQDWHDGAPDACRFRIDENSMLSAAMILKSMNENDEQYKTLAAAIDKKTGKLRDALRTQIGAVEKKLDDSWMSFEEKESLREKLIRVDVDGIPSNLLRDQEAIVDFPRAFEMVKEVESKVD